MLGVLAATIGTAQADVLVLRSTVPTIQVGRELKDAEVLSIPAGQTLIVLSPSGRTQTIRGPFSGPVGILAPGEVRDAALWGQVKQILDQSARKVTAVATRSPGARPSASASEAAEGMRGAAPAAADKGGSPPRPIAFSWRVVPIDPGGDVCVEKGAPLMLGRQGTGAASYTLIDVQGAARADVRFGATDASVPWPALMPIRTGGYSLAQAPAPARAIRLRLIEPLPEAEQTLRVLHAQRCRVQMEAWLRGVAVASR